MMAKYCKKENVENSNSHDKPVVASGAVYGLDSKTLATLYVVSLTSEATPLATPFFKRTYKISHTPPIWVDLPSFATSSKIEPNFL